MKEVSGYLYRAIGIVVIGSLLFGINMAAVSGAVSLVQAAFTLSDFQIGIVVSAMIIGCMIGAFTAGSLSDKRGRKATFIYAAILFSISAIGCYIANSMWVLAFARILGGIGVGTVSVVVPTYISEVSPAKVRGTLGTLNQLGIVIGILLAYIIDYAASPLENNWRIMLGQPLPFALLFLFLLIFFLPESPRWLINAKKEKKAAVILEKMGGRIYALEVMASVKGVQSESVQQTSLSSLFKGGMGKVIGIGILLATFQQVTGINAVISYAPVIFQQSGVGGDTALLQSILVGVVNFLFTLVALWVIDRAGRKVLLLYGAAGMSVFLFYLTYSFTVDSQGIGVLISLLGYIAFFAASWAPVMWIVTSEIYPNNIRGAAMSVSTAISWVCTFILVQFFPWMLSNLGGAVTFGLFGIFSVLAWVFTKTMVPETKGKSLEEIEQELGIDN
ncbi:sugar porter family MFS transporter [Limibacter armeniacum]|uniref:sugar porter family MFS transporter n=1 Tax=Limibacter armeniacum TaxID=466084 RepID=UPI002FE55581